MRAAVIREYNADLSLETVPDPICEADGVVLKVLACGICRSDWHGWVGEHPKVKLGAIPGHEYCGEVVEAGPLAKWRVGDRVIAPFILSCGQCPECQSGQTTTCRAQRVPGFGEPGAYAEYISVPHAHNLARLPESITPVLAAGLGCRVTTAWHALTGRANIRAGEWLAVHGTGGVGLSLLILGRALGARVVALAEGAAVPHFALTWLGMGGDGHIASLFPNTDPQVDDAQALRRLVPDPLPPEAPFARLSLTIPALLDSDALLFVMRGADKRAVFDAALRGEHDLPVARLLGAAHQPVTCFT